MRDLQGARAWADGLLFRRDFKGAQAGEIDDALDAEAAQDRLAVRGLDVPQIKHVQNLKGIVEKVTLKTKHEAGTSMTENGHKCTQTKTYYTNPCDILVRISIISLSKIYGRVAQMSGHWRRHHLLPRPRSRRVAIVLMVLSRAAAALTLLLRFLLLLLRNPAALDR